jgi:hypothetical protein
MALAHYQVGAIIASCAGTALLIVVLILIFIHPVRRLTWSRQKPPPSILSSTTNDVESQRLCVSDYRFSVTSRFETIGNLIIPPSRRPLPLALDIINRLAMTIGLPAGAKPANLKASSMAEALGSEFGVPHSVVAMVRQASAQHSEAVVQERKAEVYDSSQRADSAVATKDCGFDLDLASRKAEQPEDAQDIFVVGHYDDDEDDEPVIEGSAHHEAAHDFGSGKSMAALYHPTQTVFE